MNISLVLKFVEFINLFQQVKRRILVKSEERYENDAEHSFQLAMLCWYYASTNNLNLDIDKVIKYALVHDLVEIYAGDTYVYEKDIAYLNSKADREHQALMKITGEFADFPELPMLIAEYELRDSEEAKYVYAFDKIIPILNIFNDQGRTWQRGDVNLDMLIEAKDLKIRVSKDLVSLWEDLVRLLNENSHYFSSK
jgi:putative hydrolase of HD superfamily